MSAGLHLVLGGGHRSQGLWYGSAYAAAGAATGHLDCGAHHHLAAHAQSAQQLQVRTLYTGLSTVELVVCMMAVCFKEWPCMLLRGRCSALHGFQYGEYAIEWH